MKRPIEPPREPVELTSEEAERLIRALHEGKLSAADRKRVAGLIRLVLWLQSTLQETRIGLSRLKRLLFGAKTEKRPRKGDDDHDGGDGGGTPEGGDKATPPADDAGSSGDAQAKAQAGEPEAKPAGKAKPRGHGRPGEAAYTGAETVFCPHEELAAGKLCPLCDQSRLYEMEPLKKLQFFGQPLVRVVRYVQARLRCAGCGAIFLAPLPEGVGETTYTTSLQATLALAHYHLGLPFKRIETFQALVGMPLPDATQWEQVEQVADTGYVVYGYLKRLAANYAWVYQDDTGARILSLIRENRGDPAPARTGMHTTVLYFEGEHSCPSLCLYVTGRQHAGENLDDVLALRDRALPPIQRMADGLAANNTKAHPSLESNCLTHGRRQFVDIEDFFPEACRTVIDAIGKVYHQEAQCKKEKLIPEQRLAHHRTHSGPVMDTLKTWMEQQIEDKQVEPNSRLGKAFDYRLKRWESLTRFLHVAGAPLDNNTAERALKIILRYRNNSLFYANEHGAHVGDILTSLIATCRAAGANPLDYLQALVENRSAVFRDPGAWLPWNYQQALADPLDTLPLSHPPPVLGHSGQLGVAVP